MINVLRLQVAYEEHFISLTNWQYKFYTFSISLSSTFMTVSLNYASIHFKTYY
jgi:hypothetical protein